MQTFFRNYIDILQESHNDILKALDGLPSAAFDWSPGQDMNSISVLVVHLTGAERYWIGDVAAQDPTYRDRDAEFKVHDLDVEFLKKRMADNLAYAGTVLNGLTLEDLHATRPARGGEIVTVAWALLHALEHTTLHLGQIQLTRQFWEQSQAHG